MLITKNIQHNILCSEWVLFNQERENESGFFIAMEEIIKYNILCSEWVPFNQERENERTVFFIAMEEIIK